MTEEARVLRGDLRFWTRIMQEHGLFIARSAPNDRPDITAEAQGFAETFTQLRWAVERGSITRALIRQLRDATLALLGFKRRLLAQALQCQITNGNLYPLFLDHVAREAVEFLRILDGYCHEPGASYHWLLRWEVFWTKVMADHARFLHAFLDPSERELAQVTDVFAHFFDDLFIHSWELQSMAQAAPEEFPTVGRFTKQVREKTEELRDFKLEAKELISTCQVLGLAPAALADHVAREAEYFLEVLGRDGY